MSESNQLKAHSLECLRLEADCRELAMNARTPDLMSHFVRMAEVWSALAISGPSSRAGKNGSEAQALMR